MAKRSFGTVRRLASGRFQARYPFNGEKVPAPQTFTSYGEARAWLDAKKVELNEGQHVDPRKGRIPFSSYAESWRHSSEVAGLAVSTRNRDLGYLNRYVLPEFGHLRLNDLDYERVDRWVVKLLATGGAGGNGLSPDTVRVAGLVLKKILARAVRTRHIRINPCEGVKLPKSAKKPITVISEPEIYRLAEVIDRRYQYLPIVACFTGLRPGELVGLTWRRVDFVNRTIEVQEVVIESEGRLHAKDHPKSTAGVRRVPMTDQVIEALQQQSEQVPSGPVDWIFPGPMGGPTRLNNFRKRFWSEAVRAAGITPNFRPHDMRHTAISLWIAAGADVKQVSAFAGHESVSFTLDRYGHLLPTSHDAFLAKLNAASDSSAKFRGTPTGHESMAEILPIGRTPARSRRDTSGASKNRTCDLSIISAAL